MHPGRTDGSRIGPLFTPTNFVGEPSLGGIRRVVVLPVWGGSAASLETAAELEANEVRQQQRPVGEAGGYQPIAMLLEAPVRVGSCERSVDRVDYPKQKKWKVE